MERDTGPLHQQNTSSGIWRRGEPCPVCGWDPPEFIWRDWVEWAAYAKTHVKEHEESDLAGEDISIYSAKPKEEKVNGVDD